MRLFPIPVMPNHEWNHEKFVVRQEKIYVEKMSGPEQMILRSFVGFPVLIRDFLMYLLGVRLVGEAPAVQLRLQRWRR